MKSMPNYKLDVPMRPRNIRHIHKAVLEIVDERFCTAGVVGRYVFRYRRPVTASGGTPKFSLSTSDETGILVKVKPAGNGSCWLVHLSCENGIKKDAIQKLQDLITRERLEATGADRETTAEELAAARVARQHDGSMAPLGPVDGLAPVAGAETADAESKRFVSIREWAGVDENLHMALLAIKEEQCQYDGPGDMVTSRVSKQIRDVCGLKGSMRGVFMALHKRGYLEPVPENTNTRYFQHRFTDAAVRIVQATPKGGEPEQETIRLPADLEDRFRQLAKLVRDYELGIRNQEIRVSEKQSLLVDAQCRLTEAQTGVELAAGDVVKAKTKLAALQAEETRFHGAQQKLKQVAAILA